MIFSSIPFLYVFLPIVVLCYFCVPVKWKNGCLLLASLLFYAWGEPKYVLSMLFAITQGYIFGRLIEKYRGTRWSKIFLATSVCISFCMLGYYKYADFFLKNFNAATGLSIPLLKVVLPIGISFYTFQIVSYLIDVYRGNAAAQTNYINLAAYVSMFPQLIAGPIVRYVDIARELDYRNHTVEMAAAGVRRFLFGLSKKILLANTLGQLVDICKTADDKTVLLYWIYGTAYTLHVYFDFSGYSDMAIGLGQIFGFHFMENFNYPYISRSITEFWRRWHISLGSWFRDYLYIPLGGNRVSKLRWVFNILVVWMATGLWHGAEWNFVFWGLLFAVLLVIEKFGLGKLLGKCRPFAHIYVLFFVILSFLLFDASSLSQYGQTLASLFGFAGLPLYNAQAVYYLRSFLVLILIGCVGATPLPRYLILKVKTGWGEKLVDVLEPLFLVLLLAVCTAYLIDGSYNPFLYFRF